jgi:hypothetical protein
MSGSNPPDVVWSDLTGIDVFIPHGPSWAQIEAALQRAFGLAAGAVVDANTFQSHLIALSGHPMTVSVHRLSGPRFGWKCDANGVFSDDMRRHIRALAECLNLAVFALNEAKANPDALLAFQPDGTCATDWLRHDDNALSDPPHVKDPS